MAVLRVRVDEAARWTAKFLDPEDQVGSLRRLVSQPTAIALVDDHLGQAVRAVAGARAKLLSNTTRLRPSGRVLAFLPHLSLSDGAAAQETGGWFDAADMPPCDTWIALIERDGHQDGPILLSWIPEPLFGQTDWALEVNPEECLRWLRAGDPELSRAIEG